MSFSLTQRQILDQEKTVTRRLGWEHLKVGEYIQPVVKCMGLKKGEKLQYIGCPIIITKVKSEPLKDMVNYYGYGVIECGREGFPNLTPDEFIDFFCKSHKGCKSNSIITRIGFRYSIPKNEL